MPSRGSLICVSIAAETLWRMRTASLRARAGSAIGPPGAGRPGQGQDAVVRDAGWPLPRATAVGPLAGTRGELASRRGEGVLLLIGVAEQLPVRREQRHLRPLGQQPLAGVKDVGHLKIGRASCRERV